MKKILLSALVFSAIYANSGEEIFKTKCMMCHTTQKEPTKANLIGPPINEVMFHIKESFSDKKEAIAFMKDYIFNPDPKKALCPSIDKFGIMPSQKGILDEKETNEVLEYLFDTFPTSDFKKRERKDRRGITFEKLDKNRDGFISPEEFIEFRAKRNNIDVNSFKANLFFKRVDLNNDGKMDREEFEKMRALRMQKQGR